MMQPTQAKFHIGQVVADPQFQFRGVIVDVDHCYAGSKEWYEKNAPHRPPKNEPWYHILVHNSGYRIYAAESTLELELAPEPVHHPEVEYFFAEFKQGTYVLRRRFDV